MHPLPLAINCRMVLIIKLLHYMGVQWAFEQPMTSLMQWHPRVQQLLGEIKAARRSLSQPACGHVWVLLSLLHCPNCSGLQDILVHGILGRLQSETDTPILKL